MPVLGRAQVRVRNACDLSTPNNYFGNMCVELGEIRRCSSLSYTALFVFVYLPIGVHNDRSKTSTGLHRLLLFSFSFYDIFPQENIYL